MLFFILDSRFAFLLFLILLVAHCFSHPVMLITRIIWDTSLSVIGWQAASKESKPPDYLKMTVRLGQLARF